MPSSMKNRQHEFFSVISRVRYRPTLNGRFSDVNGHITCTANGGSSVVDYFVACTELFRSVTDFVVDNFDVSDHLPVVCKLKLNPTIKIGEEQP